MEDELFEQEYADELNALDELDYEPPVSSAPKSKRSLQFSSQTDKTKNKVRQSQDRIPGSNDEFFDDVLQYSSDEGGDSQPSTLFRPQNNSVALDVEGKGDGDNFRRKRLLESWDEEDEVDGFTDLIEATVSSQKRMKLTKEQDADERLLQQIMEQRATSNLEIINSRIMTEEIRQNDGDDVERQRVLKHIPHCDFISARSYDGCSVYMKLWDKDVLESDYLTLASNPRSSGLLVPIGTLLDQIQLQQLESENEPFRIDDDIERENTEQSIEMSALEDDNRITDEVDDVTAGMKSLWVEKYAPRKYTELLSEEAVNRNLLHWIKLWDYVVFNKEVPKAKKKDKNADNNNKKFKKKFEPDVLDSLDNFKRPQQKIALLCGPPGLGKTTLAHIVARHAGYNVVEMNASDDRTADVFRTKIESATQMKAVLGGDHSPNCLVIDEIDGAPSAAINVLLNMIKKSDGNEISNKKKKDGGILRRPIICICNDQYVPALRQLRQIALIVNFPQTEASRLASRLYEVVQVEELKADINTLLALCERTDNDIRACLNTLQFVRQKQKELSLQTVRTMSVGQKDSQKSFFAVWQSVFSMPREKKNRFVSIQDLAEGNQSSLKGNNMTPQARFWHVLHMVQSAGEYDRVIQGLFENYLSAKCKDPHLSGLCMANDWLGFVDGLNQYLAKSQDYSVARYMSFLPVLFHFLYASYNPQKLVFPHSQTEANQKLIKTKNLMNTMIADMSPMVRKFIDPVQIVLDLLSPLIDVLQPTLRPVNTLLYSNREKEELANVVRIMIAYNMTYRQEKTLEGQYVYALDPNVEEIVQFPDLKQRKQLTYAAKQLIAREIELEKMRRNEGFKPADNSNNMNVKRMAEAKPSNPVRNESNTNEEKIDEEKSDKPAIPNHLRKLEAKKISGSDKPAVNFFGKFVRTKREKSTMQSDSSERAENKDKSKLLDSVIWFHFKEGYSNAVRKTIKISDLL